MSWKNASTYYRLLLLGSVVGGCMFRALAFGQDAPAVTVHTEKTADAAAVPTSLPPAQLCKAYSVPLSPGVEGAWPFTFALQDREATACVNLDPLVGTLSGTPGAACLGTHLLQMVITDNAGKQAFARLVLHVQKVTLDAKIDPATCKALGSDPIKLGIEVRGLPRFSESPREGATRVTLLAQPAADPDATQVTPGHNLGLLELTNNVGPCDPAHGTPILLASGKTSDPPKYSAAVDGHGVVTLTLAAPLVSGQLVCPYEWPQSSASADKEAAEANKNTPAQSPAPATKPNPKSGVQAAPAATQQSSRTPTGGPFRDNARPDFQGVASSPAGQQATRLTQVVLNTADVRKNAPRPATIQPNNPVQRAEGQADVQTKEYLVDTKQRNAEYVVDPMDWGLVQAYFTGGILLANDDSASNGNGASFSTAHQFLSLDLDKTWLLPGCYVLSSCYVRNANRPINSAACASKETTGCNSAASWFSRHYPGINTYFEARLTAIPVASNPASALSIATAGVAATAPQATASNTTSTTNQTFLTTQNTGRVGVGAYMPLLITRWSWNRRQQALFLAPLLKTGFDTLTGPITEQIASNGGAASYTLERVYNFYSFGGRVGHSALGRSVDHAADLNSYLDVTIGRYSNLESYVCHPTGSPDQVFAASQCANTYSGIASSSQYDSAKRLYRLDLEGLLKVPNTPLVVGMNANIGQHVLGAGRLDPAFTAPDDVRFLFGTRFDISHALSRMGLSLDGGSISTPKK